MEMKLDLINESNIILMTVEFSWETIKSHKEKDAIFVCYFWDKVFLGIPDWPGAHM